MAMVVHSSLQFKKSYYISTNKKKVLHPCDIKQVNSGSSSQANRETNIYKEFWCRENEDSHNSVKSISKKQDDDNEWTRPDEPDNKGK